MTRDGFTMTFKADAPVLSVASSPDGRFLLTGHADTTALLRLARKKEL